MTTVQVGSQIITSEQIFPLLVGYQLHSSFLREAILDQAIADITCTSEETAIASQQFFQHHQIDSEQALTAWTQYYNINIEKIQALATRPLRIAKFKQATWGGQLESHFLNYKSKLDKVVYSLIRTKDPLVAQELYFRIQAKEQTFPEVAREYSQGPEAQTGGIQGPVELSVPHPALAKMLSVSKPGQLLPPTRIGEWMVIVRLEKFIPAVLDEQIRQQILNNLFETWIAQQVNQELKKWQQGIKRDGEAGVAGEAGEAGGEMMISS